LPNYTAIYENYKTTATNLTKLSFNRTQRAPSSDGEPCRTILAQPRRSLTKVEEVVSLWWSGKA